MTFSAVHSFKVTNCDLKTVTLSYENSSILFGESLNRGGWGQSYILVMSLLFNNNYVTMSLPIFVKLKYYVFQR